MDNDVDIDPDAEIDPELFIKCRLCVEEKGLYQIVPIVQQQIKFCFDIVVKRFDCLPQLICKKCKIILNEYCDTKKKFVENQHSLNLKLNLNKISSVSAKAVEEKLSEVQTDQVSTTEELTTQVNEDVDDDVPIGTSKSKVPEQSAKSSCDETDVTKVNNTSKRKSNKSKKKRRRISSLSSSSERIPTTSRNANAKQRSKTPETEGNKKVDQSSWEICYKKKIVCRFCGEKFKTKRNIRRHVSLHYHLLNTYKTHIKKHCMVSLDRIDDRLNVTGEDKTVVLRPDTIILDEGSPNYYLKYIPNIVDNNLKAANLRKSVVLDGDSSDDDFIKQNKRKRIRLHSRTSSNETLVIDDKKVDQPETKKESSEDESSDVQCINLDDSSNDTFDSNINGKSGINVKESDSKTIKDIISVCYNKYTSNICNDSLGNKSEKDSSLDKMLDRKLLSIGRKILSIQGMTSPGLLKYLQHKDLAITWFPINVNNHNSKMNYVRIMTRVKDVTKDNNITKGWNIHKENALFKEPTRNIISNDNSQFKAVAKQNVLVPNTDKQCTDINTVVNPSISNKTENHNGMLKSLLEKSNVSLELCISDNDASSKLLNASPVANPKKFPKKILTDMNSVPANFNESNLLFVADDGGDFLHMPIITSTESLAPSEANAKTANINNSDQSSANAPSQTASDKNNEPTFPRIKCKPVSELMRPPSNNVVSMAVPATGNISIQLHPMAVAATMAFAPAPPPVAFAVAKPGTSSVMMDSVYLPNMPTDRPITYFKNLLQIHNLVLITEFNAVLQKEFVGLIKFKLDVNTANMSIILRIELHAMENKFCIKVRRSDFDEMNWENLAPFMQCEILKSFKGSVSEKLLITAKAISQTLFDNAKQFVYLLNTMDLSNCIK